ncbi:unnamed protein product [Lactuca saligna]|uniref:PIR2-like helical domain-containing protein n=1 Tax=Lactuca saligna TaxID=75948 RepID=A0AA35VY19_LACSI|nr:unnamed protein product [Lactuca saligna]
MSVTSPGSDLDPWSNLMGFQFGFNPSAQTPNLNPNVDDKSLDHYTDKQLEDFMLKKLELFYNETISKLDSLGYNENFVLEAVLRNGHFQGNMDPLTNMLDNTQLYLSTRDSGCKDKLASECQEGVC